MIKVILLTGFLGAGKTTLLKALLASYKEEKIGVIINEFGEINVDAKLVSADGIQMAELSNGSIFCACIKDKFVDSLIEMAGRDLSVLFIEASGLADPSNMGQILEGIKVQTGDAYDYQGSICVADAVHFAELADVLPALSRQVEYAGAVILNKIDLVSEEELAEAAAQVRENNPGVEIFPATYCQVDMREIVSRLSPSSKESADSTNTFETRPQTFILKATEDISMEELKAFLTAVAPSAFRIKGFVKTPEGDVEVSAVGADVAIIPWDKGADKSELVAISSVGMKLLSVLLAASKEHAGGRFKV